MMGKMTDLIDFFVIASPKSGTTWVQKMLCSHPQVHCAESRLYGLYFDPRVGASTHLPLEQYVRFMSDYHQPAGDECSREAYFDGLLDRLVFAIASHAREQSGKPVYGEKLTPYHGTAAHVLDQVRTRHPASRLVHLVRDPRDVIASGMAHWRRALAAQPDGESHRYSDTGLLFDDLLDHWVEIQRAMFEASALTVRYEDLTRDPFSVFGQMLCSIGVDDSDEVVARCVEANTFAKLSGGRVPGQVDNGSFYRRGTPGGWVSELSPAQADRVHEQADHLLARYGYDEGLTPSPPPAR